MKKNISWVNGEGRLFQGVATLNVDEGYITMENKKGQIFEKLETEQIENGMTLEEIFDEIPEDITDFELGGKCYFMVED